MFTLSFFAGVLVGLPLVLVAYWLANPDTFSETR